MFMERKSETERQIKMLQDSLEKINYKCRYYETALTAGTTKIHDSLPDETIESCPYSNDYLNSISSQV
ncbi:MAG TPA: hypothetical protein VN456_13550 [Desulfosporosinus sp.]|nr:hypothetical protein [Desulfosporosinus sp.]